MKFIRLSPCYRSENFLFIINSKKAKMINYSKSLLYFIILYFLIFIYIFIKIDFLYF